MVHDKAFFGTQEFFRCDILEIVLDLVIAAAFAGVAAIILRIRNSRRNNQEAEQVMDVNRP